MAGTMVRIHLPPAKSRANDGHRCDLIANSDPGLASLAEVCTRRGVSHRFLRKCGEQNSPARYHGSAARSWRIARCATGDWVRRLWIGTAFYRIITNHLTPMAALSGAVKRH